MRRPQDLPEGLGEDFSVTIARWHGVSRSRLRGPDLLAPFHGVRVSAQRTDPTAGIDDPYLRQRVERIERARLYAPRLHTGHFFSHETAASIWGAPLPLEMTLDEDPAAVTALRPATGAELALHVSASGAVPFPRATGVTGHRTLASLTSTSTHDGLRVTSPAATWVSLGRLPVFDLVALGDYFCRQWRPGIGRRDVGRPPLATIEELRSALEAGRRTGAARLRTACMLIREDSWSPRESRVRCILVDAKLPEPVLNLDVFDDNGRFLGCIDMVYPDRKVAVEYLGMLHGESWARDVERLAALRAAGWTVIEVTAPLLRNPGELVRRVAAALER